jgi:hypothetical protein
MRMRRPFGLLLSTDSAREIASAAIRQRPDEDVALVVTPNIDHIATIRRSLALAQAYRHTARIVCLLICKIRASALTPTFDCQLGMDQAETPSRPRPQSPSERPQSPWPRRLAARDMQCPQLRQLWEEGGIPDDDVSRLDGECPLAGWGLYRGRM